MTSGEKRTIDSVDHDSAHTKKRHKIWEKHGPWTSENSTQEKLNNVEEHGLSTNGNSINFAECSSQKHLSKNGADDNSGIQCFVFTKTSDEKLVSSIFSLPRALFTEPGEIDCMYINVTDTNWTKHSHLLPDPASIPETVKTLLKQDLDISYDNLEDCDDNATDFDANPDDQYVSQDLSFTMTTLPGGQGSQLVCDELLTLPEVKVHSMKASCETSVNPEIKQKLKTNLAKKYENKPFPVVDFTPKPDPELTEEEKEKIEKRKQSNKDSARRSRENSAKKEDGLLKTINKLEKENGKLVDEITNLKLKKDCLVEIVQRSVGEDERRRFLYQRLTEALESLLCEH